MYEKLFQNWVVNKPYINQIYFFGSHVTGISSKTGLPPTSESDLDVAIDYDAMPGDESSFVTWVGQFKKWEEELEGLLGPESPKPRLTQFNTVRLNPHLHLVYRR